MRESIPALLESTRVVQSQMRGKAERRVRAGSLISHPLSPATKARRVENEAA